MVEITIKNSVCQLITASLSLKTALRTVMTYTNSSKDFAYWRLVKQIKRLNALLDSKALTGPYVLSTELSLKKLTFQARQLDRERKISLLEGDEFPTGLLPRVEKYLKGQGIEYRLKDVRKQPKIGSVKFNTRVSIPALRHYQKAAVKQILASHRGIVVAPTGTGKTVMLVKMIWELGVNSLIITPSKPISDMMVETMTHYFGKGKVVKLTTKSKKVGVINVCNIQALQKIKPEVLRGIDALFIDEFHHCLTSDAVIVTDKGRLNIGNIVRNRIDCRVLSWNKDTQSFEYKNIKNYFEYDAPGEFVEITYECGGKSKTLRCTANHKIWTTNRGYVEAENLTPDDDVVITPGYVCNICDKEHQSYSGLGGCTVNHHTSDEVKKENGKRMSRHSNHNNPNARIKNSHSKLGNKNPAKRLEVRKKKSVSQKAWWDSLSQQERAWRLETFVNAPIQGIRKGKTKFEHRVESLNVPGLVFTGDGSFWLNSINKNMNPDFIFKDQEVIKVVEVGDTDFWHDPEDMGERISELHDLGIKCLYLTTQDMKTYSDEDLKLLITGFLHG